MSMQYFLFPEMVSHGVTFLSNGNLSLLKDWVAENLDQVLNLGSENEKEMVKFLQGSFIELDEGITGEDEFKQELGQLITLLGTHNSQSFSGSNASAASSKHNWGAKSQNLYISHHFV